MKEDKVLKMYNLCTEGTMKPSVIFFPSVAEYNKIAKHYGLPLLRKPKGRKK